MKQHFTSQELIASALELPTMDRVAVASAIWSSIGSGDADEDSHQAVHDAWSAEIAARVTEINEGSVKTIPSSEVWKMIDVVKQR